MLLWMFPSGLKLHIPSKVYGPFSTFTTHIGGLTTSSLTWFLQKSHHTWFGPPTLTAPEVRFPGCSQRSPRHIADGRKLQSLPILLPGMIWPLPSTSRASALTQLSPLPKHQALLVPSPLLPSTPLFLSDLSPGVPASGRFSWLLGQTPYHKLLWCLPPLLSLLGYSVNVCFPHSAKAELYPSCSLFYFWHPV